MGTVYSVRDLLGNEFALKVLHQEYSGDESFRARFLNEARVMKNLGAAHPHILEVNGFHPDENGVTWMQMPLIKGIPATDGESRWVTLRDRMDDEAQFPLVDVFEIVDQILDAVSYAHDTKVLHRDIKPANILLDEDGIVVADFGLAQAIDPEEYKQQLKTTWIETKVQVDNSGDPPDLSEIGDTIPAEKSSRAEAMIGTIQYMAPELLPPLLEDHSERSDLYSIGLIAFQLLTGKNRPSFSSKPSKLRDDLSDEVDDWVGKALEEEPDERFASASEMRDAWLEMRSLFIGKEGADTEPVSDAEPDPDPPSPWPKPRPEGRRTSVGWEKILMGIFVAVIVVSVSVIVVMKFKSGGFSGTAKDAGVDGENVVDVSGGDDGSGEEGDAEPSSENGSTTALPGDTDEPVLIVDSNGAAPEPKEEEKDFAERVAEIVGEPTQAGSVDDADAREKEETSDYPDTFAAPGPDEGPLTRVKEIIDAFVYAPSWEDRLKYCYQVERLRPAIEAYYEKWPYVKISRFSNQLFQMEMDEEMGGPYWVYLISTKEGDQGFPVIVRVEDGNLKVDWEIFVEFHDRHLAKFLEGEMSNPGTYRVVLERKSDYYGLDRDSFSDLDDYYVFGINAPYGELNEFSDAAFVRRDSPMASDLDAVVGLNDEPLAVILTLERVSFPHGTEHLVIKEYVTEGWFTDIGNAPPGKESPGIEGLVFVDRKQQEYKLEYAARPDAERFQIRRLPTAKWPQPENFYLRVGDTSEDGQFRIESFEEKEMVRNGINLDASVITIVYLPTQETYELLRQTETVIPTYFAEFSTKDEDIIFVKEGDSFSLPSAPGETLRVEKVNEESVVVSSISATSQEPVEHVIEKR